jgi:DNA-binding GntR family transcriptional regulator
MTKEAQTFPRNGKPESKALLKQNLAMQIREEILQGKIVPGEKIIEGRWARHFGVAQVSIREAINILTTEGFVTKGHGRSARVLKLKESDIIHIYQVRAVLEGLAARIITERKLPLQDLEAAIADIENAVAANEPRRVVDCIQAFHLCLLEKPGNAFLFESGRRLIVPLLAFTRMRVKAKNLDAGPWVPQVPNHQRIVDALRMGDPHLAEQIVIHIMSLFLKSALTVWAH